MPPPLAHRGSDVDVLHGHAVSDPYRWLEDEHSAAVQAYVDAQDQFARAVLQGAEHREAYRQRLQALVYVDRRSVPIRRGGRLFWNHTPAGTEKSRTVWQEGAGAVRTLIDPLERDPEGHTSVSGIRVSPDGTLVAYLVQADNADEATLEVMRVDGSEVLTEERIQGLRYTSPAWSGDGKAFYYVWMPSDGELSANERLARAEVRCHTIGTSPAMDQVVRPSLGDEARFPSVSVSDDGRWLMVSESHGWSENTVYVRDLEASSHEWAKVGGQPNTKYDVVAHGDHLLILTNAGGASRFKVLLAQAGTLAEADWQEIVPEDEEAVVQSVDFIGGRLVIHRLRRAASELIVRDLSGASIRPDPLLDEPFQLGGSPVTVSSISGRADSSEMYVVVEGYDRPPEIWRVDLSSGDTQMFHRPPLPFEPSSMVVETVQYVSTDGTPVSMVVVRSPDASKDGQQPTLLYGYGGFSISLVPQFSPKVVAWVEQGGIYAVAHLRGGGEYGEAWHRSGMLSDKQQVFDDFIAAAEHLIQDGWTSSPHLGISGASNGGLLVGAAMTQRPELFGAVVCGVPLLDMVRYHRFGVAGLWVPEYGSPEDGEAFAWLFAYSPYHRIQQGVSYPPLLMLSADHDDRVDPMHARKFVAQVQWANGTLGGALLRVERNAGHGGADLRHQWVESATDELTFLRAKLCDTGP